MKRNTLLIGGLIGIAALVGVGVYAFTANPKAETLAIGNPQTQIDALRSFVDKANKASGITSGAVFNYESNGYGGAANFGIVRCINEVRCDGVIVPQVARFHQSNTPSDDLAEVDATTNKIVSLHRAVPTYAIKGELPQAEVERIAREFLTTVYPEFANVEASLTYDSGMKEGRLNNGNYFFRWNDMKYTLPEGLSMDVPPHIQVGITSSGFVFGYENSVQLFKSITPAELQAAAEK